MKWPIIKSDSVEVSQTDTTCEMLWAVAQGAKVSIHPSIIEMMDANAAFIATDNQILVSKRHWLTGYPSEPSDNLAQGFILGHCAGVGAPFSDEIVRGAIFARTKVLSSGQTGCRGVVIAKMVQMLNQNIVPSVPSQGSVGAAGDLAPMSHIARTLCGYDGQRHPDFTPLVPTGKEALALINGISLSTAIAAIAVMRAERVFEAALWAAGLTMEVVRAQSQCLDNRALRARRHPEVEEVGNILRRLLKGSQRVLRNNKPDAFSIRATPSVMGAIWRTIRFAKKEVERELNGVSDNPLIFESECKGNEDTTGEWIEAGNFHGASIGLAMDHLATALTQLATLSERRIFKLTHGKLSNNLPSFLVQGTGLNSGFMLAQYTAAALASECKGFAHPASADSIPTVQHHEDHVSMSPIAARKALKILECLADIVAIELLVGAQALDLRRQVDQLSAPLDLENLHRIIRKDVPFWEDDEVLHPAIRALSLLVRQGIPLPLITHED